MTPATGIDVAWTERAHRAMPYAELLGVEIVSADREQVVARLPWAPQRCTSGGLMHGGALMGLADAIGGMLAAANLPDDASGTATVSSSTNFLRGLREGYALATARLLHRGRTTIVVETDLRDADGRHLARVTQVQAVLYG